jgi:hypothetical protein
MLIRDLGLLAAAVYDVNGNVPGFTCLARHNAASALNGFQAAAFQAGNQIVVAFRGTDQRVDVGHDLMLGGGMNTSYFSAGEQFTARFANFAHVTVCGHSLGGAIAQVVANRMKLPMVTFNAPGVGVIASREVFEASPLMTVARTGGMAASAVMHPMQAYRDMRSAFNVVKGLNICLEGDVVSRIGLHYGEVIRIPGTSMNPATEHRIVTVNAVLEKNPLGARPAIF